MLSTSDSYYDSPLYPRLNPASRHDSISLLGSLSEFSQQFTLGAIDRILLDAAHDAEAIYELLVLNNVEPFINLNPRPKDNLRLFTKTPRYSKLLKNTYKRRTSVERSNKREKIDYHLEAGRHRSTKMWYIRLFAIIMCQHIDAWHFHYKEDF